MRPEDLEFVAGMARNRAGLMLGMERASFFYGSSRVFENVSFLLDGARTALVGENGAGKSTLTKVMAGVVHLTSGSMWVDGVEVAPRTPLDALPDLSDTQVIVRTPFPGKAPQIVGIDIARHADLHAAIAR